MIYKTFKEWKDGNYLEDLEPRKEAYTRDELLLVEMGWKYGFDAGVEAGRKDEREKVAQWMIQRSYATGHGDTTEDLLAELEWQVREELAKAQGENND